MRLSRADFSAIKSKIAKNKAKRALRAADNAALDRKSNPRPISWQDKIKILKKRILGPGGLWSQAVRRRDKYRCLMCGKTEHIQAHHWLFRRSHSLALAVDPANGITLCYGCHIGRVHHNGDGDFIIRMFDVMVALIGPEKISSMRETALSPKPLGLDFWEQTESSLRVSQT